MRQSELEQLREAQELIYAAQHAAREGDWGTVNLYATIAAGILNRLGPQAASRLETERRRAVWWRGLLSGRRESQP